MASKEIEKMIQGIEEWMYEKYGPTTLSIDVLGYDDDYDIVLSYRQGSKYIEDTVVSRLTEDELRHYINDGELKRDIKIAMKPEGQAIMEVMTIAVNRFQFHAWNYPYSDEPYELPDGTRCKFPRFIMEVDWNCNRAHMINKWLHAVRDDESNSYMPRFYAELSSDNRQRLIKWVIKHYTDEQKFSFQYFNSED